MLNPAVKRLALFSIFLYIFLVQSHYTTADVFAERVVSQNKLRAMTLDISAQTSFNNNPLTSLFHSMGILPDGFDLGAVRVRGQSSTNFKYNMRAVKVSGDDSFCDKLDLEVQSRSQGKIYSGALFDFSRNSALPNGQPEDWIFFVGLADGHPDLKNKICEFNFNMRTFRSDPEERGGIFAERLVRNVVSSGTWQ